MTFPSQPVVQEQTLTHGVCTHILISLNLRESADLRQAMSMLREEMVATAELCMSGKIQQWFSQLDERGVLFHFKTYDLKETRSLMADLPLLRADLVDLHFTRLGPLQPMRALLAPLPDLRQAAEEDGIVSTG